MDPESGRLVAATADNLAAWHDVNLRALGYRTRYEGGFWLTLDRVPVIFFSAIGMRPAADAERMRLVPRSSWVTASDPWQDLALDAYGFQPEPSQPWMARRVDSIARPPSPPAELSIDPVVDEDALAEFETTSAEGFGGHLPGRFTWVAPGVLTDPRMRIWAGRVGGRIVSSSMGFVHAGVVGVYGVSTLPAFRGRGYATALTWQAVMADPGLPAVLQPSQMAEAMYAGLGFGRFAEFGTWSRPAAVRVELGPLATTQVEEPEA